MTYSSLIFIYGFLPVSLLLYYITPVKFRNFSLLALSLIFCGFFSIYYLMFMIEYTLANYIAGLLIERNKKSRYRAVIPLTAGITADVIILFMYRAERYEFLRDGFNVPQGFFPTGISFAMLSAVSYLADVYRKNIKAEVNIIRFMLYIMMFPKIIAGPFVRYSAFLKILGRKKINLSDFGKNTALFVKGLSKKVIAGDGLFRLYSAVMSIETGRLSAVNAWIGASAYIMCLYFSLSGIMDMGTGIGGLFGMKFPHSFNYPLFSVKLRNFALRWNIRVNHWFRYYIYTPIFENFGKSDLVFLFTWGIMGLWYKLNFNGFMWGFLFGVAIVSERMFKGLKATGIIWTGFVVTVLSAVLMNNSIFDSARYIFAMFGGNRIIADYMTLYLLRNYIVIFLVCLYASSNVFRNMMTRSGNSRIKSIVSVISPVIVFVMLVLCTALMSRNGCSEYTVLRF